MMPSLYGMDGHQPTWPPRVSVVNPLMSNMHSHVQEEAFQHISWPHKVCHEVCVEPDLQPVAPGQLSGASANQQDGARVGRGSQWSLGWEI